MVLPFPQKWGNAADRRVPSTEENANGFACGPADPSQWNYLFYRQQEAINNLAAQLEVAAAAVDLTWAEGDPNALDAILKTYQDIISENRVINVPADFDTIADAMDYLSKYRISNFAQVVINVAAGTYNHGTKVISGHPDGLRVKVLGPALPSGMVTESNFQVTGSSGANIATDRIVNEAMLRGRFPVVIQSTNGAVDTETGDLTIENICFIGSGANSGVKTASGKIVCTNVSVHNYGTNWLVDRGGGVILADGCTGSGAVSDGFIVTNNGTLKAEGGVASGNGGAGFSANVGGTIIAPSSTAKGNGGALVGGYFVSLSGIIQARASKARNNAGDGFLVTNDGFIQAAESISQNNGGYGYNIFNGGRVNANSSTSTANLSDYRCMNFGNMSITGYGGTAAASPTVNTVGNGNCYIKN